MKRDYIGLFLYWVSVICFLAAALLGTGTVPVGEFILVSFIGFLFWMKANP